MTLSPTLTLGKLLERGEGVKDEGNLCSDGDVKEQMFASNGVEITVPVPEHMRYCPNGQIIKIKYNLFLIN